MLRLDLVCSDGLGIVQDSDYGPIVFRLRERIRDRYIVTIGAAGAAGDTVTVALYGADSDATRLAKSVTYIVQSGDGVEEVAAGLAIELMAATVEAFSDFSGKLETVAISDHVQSRADVADVEISAVALGECLDLSVSTTGATVASVSSHPDDVRVDLTGAVITAVLRETEDSATVIDTWDDNEFTVLSPATAGRFALEVGSATSQGYDFDRAWYQLEVYNSSTGARKRWFEGAVELDRSMMIGLGGYGGGTLPP